MNKFISILGILFILHSGLLGDELIESKNTKNYLNSRYYDHPAYFKQLAGNVFNDTKRIFTDVPNVYKNMFTVPFAKTNIKNTGITLGLLGTSFLFDESFNDFSRDEWEPVCNIHVRHIRLPLPIINLTHKNEKYWFRFDAPNSFHYDFIFLTFAEYGYVFSLLTDNEEFRGLCFNLLQATTYSFMFAQPLKPLIGRGRPYRDQDNWEDIGPLEWGHSSFKTASQYTAFPSFHATFYSAYCTVFMDYLGHRWAGPILGAFCFFQQPGHVHWLSDIVAGGILGYWLGSSIVDNNDYVKNKKANEETEKQSNTQLFIAPIQGGIALNLSYSF